MSMHTVIQNTGFFAKEFVDKTALALIRLDSGAALCLSSAASVSVSSSFFLPLSSHTASQNKGRNRKEVKHPMNFLATQETNQSDLHPVICQYLDYLYL